MNQFRRKLPPDERFSLLEQFLSEASDAVFLYERDLETLVYSNPAYDNLFSESERILDHIHPDDQDHVRAAMDRVQRGNVVEVEERLVRGSETTWVWVKAFPINSDEGTVQYIGGFIREIHERKQRELRLQAYEQGFPDLGFLFDSDYRYADVLLNDQTRELLYDDPHRFLGQKVGDVLPGDLAGRLEQSIDEALGSGRIQTLEYELTVPRGERVFEARLFPLQRQDSPVGYVVCVIRDITDRKRREQELKETKNRLEDALRKKEHQAHTDQLTHLPNKREFNRVLDEEWNRMRRRQEPLSLIMADLDDFKSFNDTYGHLAGDDVLETGGDIMNDQARRPADTPARFGGEEFAMVLPDTEAEGAQEVAERIRTAVRDRDIEHSGSSGGEMLTLSLGVASLVPHADADPDVLIKRADEALYQAKEQGKDRVVVHDRAE